jgi:CRP/FNR family cyclic AMP-dependent transcriptional regulator
LEINGKSRTCCGLNLNRIECWNWNALTGTRMNFTDHHHCLALSTVFNNRGSRPVSAGQILYTAADRGDSVYFLRSGLVKTSIISEKGKELLLSIHRPGVIFGELSFCSGQRREQAVAMEGSEVVEVRFDDLMSELGKSPQAMVDLLNTMCRRLCQAHDQLLTLSFDKTMERLVRKVLELVEELGDSTPEGTGIAHYIKQEELAQMIAAPREVVSSLLNELRELDLVTYSRKGRLTVSTEALRTYLDSRISE